jgi:hypothetical protein
MTARMMVSDPNSLRAVLGSDLAPEKLDVGFVLMILHGLTDRA